MAILTVRLPDKLKRQMRRLSHINWSQVARRAIEETVQAELAHQETKEARILEASRSIDQLHEEVKRMYGTVEYDSAETVRSWRGARGTLHRTPSTARKSSFQAYKADPGRIEIVKILGLREAYSRTKIAKVTFEEFENMTGEVLGE